MSGPMSAGDGFQGLELSQLSRRVGSHTLVDQLSLTVAPGEILALLGPSGCGKSSTLRLIAGLDPASSGEIRLGGRNITALPPAERQVAMVFQSYALFPHLSVERNLSLGMELRGMGRAEIQRNLDQVLALMQLEGLRQRKPAELSGGQRQRVALARALIRRPALFLLDEPMSNLDAQLREELRPQLREILCAGEAPVVYVTHDQQEAMGVADRIGVLQGGILQQCGTPQELYNSPANVVVASFIGRPQINLLELGDGSLVGIRPEHLHPVKEGGLPVRVLNREWHGANQQLTVSSRHGQLRWTTGAAQPINDQLRLGWQAEHEHRFDQATGQRRNA